MVHIPYGKSFIEFDEQGANTLSSRIGELKAEGGGSDIVRRAMEKPIDSPGFVSWQGGRKTASLSFPIIRAPSRAGISFPICSGSFAPEIRILM